VSDPRALTAEAHRTSYRIAHTDPVYPEEAKAEGIEGKVVLDLVIAPDGAILDLAVRHGHPLLAEAALQAIRNWKYRATTLNGVPVEVQTEIEVAFTLPGDVRIA
jgi:protein TonB